MGKILEALAGVSLPPEVESKIRILDLQFETLQKKYAELADEANTLRMEDNYEAQQVQHAQRAAQVPRYTTQPIAGPNNDPSDPTPEEFEVLNVFREAPPGQHIPALNIAARLGIDAIKATARLNALEKKGYLHRHVMSGTRRRPFETHYSLTDSGVERLAQ
jgi:hypothetical protein